MADYDRYGDNTRNRDRGGWRDEDRDYRSSNEDRGIFGRWGGDEDRDEDWRGRERGRLERGGGVGGWMGRDRDEDRSRGRGEDRERGFGGGGGRRESQYGPDDHRNGLPIDETGHLIASNKVEGTAVYGNDGRRLGSIHNFMVDKLSGHVEYAVMGYGSGFLGMGTRYYPLPWRMLSYDTRRGGYRIDMTERDLRNAPSFDRDTEPKFDRRYSSRVHDYYGIKY